MQSDVVVVGGGISGLFCKYLLERKGINVILITRSILRSNSYHAKGGIAFPKDEEDILKHAEDTLRAGDGISDEDVVFRFVKQAYELRNFLMEQGFRFDEETSLEGGHSARRVMHIYGSETGKGLVSQMLSRINMQSILFGSLEALIYDGRRVYGVVFRSGRNLYKVISRFVVLATGGIASLYPRHTNPTTNSPRILHLASRIPLELESLEFVQFHPTVFFAPDGRKLLITEAIRGDGAILINEKGERFVDETQTRDVVARAISMQGKAYLYAGNVNKHLLTTKYRHIYTFLKGYGYDLLKDRIPIHPAAHYFIGGIRTTLEGRTYVENLYVVGELASTRIHGANRLASNSLLECMVMSKLCADDIQAKLKYFPLEDRGNYLHLPEGRESPKLLERYASLLRHGEALESALKKVHRESITYMILKSALLRKESRGVHYRKDFPSKSKDYRGYIVWKGLEVDFESLASDKLGSGIR